MTAPVSAYIAAQKCNYTIKMTSSKEQENGVIVEKDCGKKGKTTYTAKDGNVCKQFPASDGSTSEMCWYGENYQKTMMKQDANRAAKVLQNHLERIGSESAENDALEVDYMRQQIWLHGTKKAKK